MNLQEITQLISIRDYTRNNIENLYLDKESAKVLSKLLPELDKKIVDLLQSEDFRDYLAGKTKVPKELQNVIKPKAPKKGNSSDLNKE